MSVWHISANSNHEAQVQTAHSLLKLCFEELSAAQKPPLPYPPLIPDPWDEIHWSTKLVFLLSFLTGQHRSPEACVIYGHPQCDHYIAWLSEIPILTHTHRDIEPVSQVKWQRYQSELPNGAPPVLCAWARDKMTPVLIQRYTQTDQSAPGTGAVISNFLRTSVKRVLPNYMLCKYII